MSTAQSGPGGNSLQVRDIALEVVRRGAGPPLLVLHGLNSPDPTAPWLDLVAVGGEVIAPSHPGFGASPRPDGFEAVYDLVHLYLDVIDNLGADKVTLMGLSFGGWIAAEIAALRPHRLDKLILVDSLGIKLSDRETPDILDLFNTNPGLVRQARWHDTDRYAPDHDAMSDEQLLRIARDWDALCLYGWSPYMHNPRLRRWLSRIDVPTLLLWGQRDGIVKPSYGRAYAELIPGARFTTIAAAGHHPEIEQPGLFAGAVLDFLQSAR